MPTRAERSRAIALLIVLSSLACSDGRLHPLGPEDVTGPFAWGSAGTVMRISRLWLAGQPDEAGLRAAREQGVTVVIDMRAPGEYDWDEASVARSLDLAYHNVPVPGPEPFSKAAFSQIEALVAGNPEAQILIHCASGNRAAAWLATHLVGEHGMSFESAVEVGKRAGITKPVMVEKAAAYLGEPPE